MVHDFGRNNQLFEALPILHQRQDKECLTSQQSASGADAEKAERRAVDLQRGDTTMSDSDQIFRQKRISHVYVKYGTTM